jgi:Type III restriction enzyme, res subunit
MSESVRGRGAILGRRPISCGSRPYAIKVCEDSLSEPTLRSHRNNPYPGTGKTYTAFQIIWRLWKAGQAKRVLYLADRNVLIDQTMVNDHSLPDKSRKRSCVRGGVLDGSRTGRIVRDRTKGIDQSHLLDGAARHVEEARAGENNGESLGARDGNVETVDAE